MSSLLVCIGFTRNKEKNGSPNKADVLLTE